MIVVERGLNILGAQIAERPAQPGFRRRTDGPYTWINFLKAFILSNPKVAATFTALPATAQRNPDDDPQNANEAILLAGRYPAEGKEIKWRRNAAAGFRLKKTGS